MKKIRGVYGKYFYGNEISAYGQEHGYVDYRTLAKAFDAVMCNDIIQKTCSLGYWETYCGSETYYMDYDGTWYDYDEAQERIEELKERLDDIGDRLSDLSDEDKEDTEEYTALAEEQAKIEEDIECLEDEQYLDFYQYFIVDNCGASILEEAGETVWYNETLDLYVWGVTHWGTSWDYVLTNIPCNTGEV